MLSIDKSSGQIISADTQNTVKSVDKAIGANALLCASILEVNEVENLPISAGQPALVALASGLTDLISGRGKVADATRELLKVQRASTLKETAIGCPGGLHPNEGALHISERA